MTYNELAVANAATRLQLISSPPAIPLDRVPAEVIRELFKQAPDFAAIAGLTSTRKTIPVVEGHGATKVTSRMEAVQIYFVAKIACCRRGQPTWASALIPTPTGTPVSIPRMPSNWEETLMWSRALAEPPLDAMGEDHFRLMGGFLHYGDATPDTFERLALDIFEERLALSRKYGTWFAEQVSPGWRSGAPRKRYRERWNGTYDRLVWSFGIQGHPRAHRIWKLMKARLQAADPITHEFLHDVTDIEPALRPETKAIRSWTFPYRALEFSIFEDPRGNFFVCHARSHDIRDVIRPRLAELWGATLNRCKSHRERLHCLAEFEWLWYWTNPFVRGGATTGGLLSAFLQKSLRNEGVKMSVPSRFAMQDLYVLSSDSGSYVRERVAELAKEQRAVCRGEW
ncbi:hypothetical protein F5884DRAFT_786473 [Xylogone sp. PMI_703]|nr:hypothetical protein F5884DRAFT_786473 [Xylogone sp. PMI_703]